MLKKHAREMIALKSDAGLYTFIPQNPLSLEDLEIKYEKWQLRRSPLGNELWLNWIARRKSDSQVIGHFQAGVDLQAEATLGYTVGKEFQKQGYAFEALQGLIEKLKVELKSRKIKAWVDTRNRASIALLEKLKFSQTQVLLNADFFKNEKSDEFVFELIL